MWLFGVRAVVIGTVCRERRRGSVRAVVRDFRGRRRGYTVVKDRGGLASVARQAPLRPLPPIPHRSCNGFRRTGRTPRCTRLG
jgi:hypothetical protein